MEIKRRLNKVAKRLSPQIESMNVADEMMRMVTRFEELVAYAQEKIDRSASRQVTVGQKVAKQKAELLKEIEDHQDAEADENRLDQEESLKERNERMMKSQKQTKKREEPSISDEQAQATLDSIRADNAG